MLASKGRWFGADKSSKLKALLKVCRIEGLLLEESSAVK